MFQSISPSWNRRRLHVGLPSTRATGLCSYMPGPGTWLSWTRPWHIIHVNVGDFKIPSGELIVCYGKWPFIVDFPINSMVIFHCYVSSPEGILSNPWPLELGLSWEYHLPMMIQWWEYMGIGIGFSNMGFVQCVLNWNMGKSLYFRFRHGLFSCQTTPLDMEMPPRLGDKPCHMFPMKPR